MTEQELQVIKQRAKNAAIGPWKMEKVRSSEWAIASESKSMMKYIAVEILGNNAEFIAHARQDVPALIEEVELYKKLFEKYADDSFNAKEDLKKEKNENERLRKQQLQMMSDYTNDLEVLDEHAVVNKKLRIALKKIVEQSQSGDIHELARKALEINS